jgi:GTPase
MPEITPEFRSGYVAVVGKPNVGKSTLMNTFLKQKIAAVSPRRQTTRRRQLGILTNAAGQIVFIDTPGLHVPAHRLGEFMNEEAVSALQDADLILFLVDASQNPDEEDRLLAERLAVLKAPAPPVILALNKMDQVLPADQPRRQAVFQAMVAEAGLQPAGVTLFSAIKATGVGEMLEEVIQRLPVGPPFFDEEQVTDLYEREIAADLVREAAMLHLRDEMPHVIAVRIDEYTERSETAAYIGATIFVERDSQKGIVIGQGGAMLKKIGTTARKEIEAMSGRQIFLEVRVKVQKNWRNDADALRQFGFFHREDHT